MIFIKGKLVEVEDKKVVLEMENGYKQNIEFTESKVKNQEGLKEIKSAPVGEEIILGVIVFTKSYMKDGKAMSFPIFVLTGDIVK